jgi:threonine synthase
MGLQIQVRCQKCSSVSGFNILDSECKVCGHPWRDAIYDYRTAKAVLQTELQNRPFNLWRYRELLPIIGSQPSISLGEGGTPLLKAENLGMMLGCKNLYIKDERQTATGSFKDRQASVTISALKEAGITDLVLASTGNVAMAYSAYSARAGIKLWAFLTSRVPSEKMREVALYGTQVIKVTGSYDQTKKVASEFARKKNIFNDLGAKSIPCVESMKTLAFEIAEQLALEYPEKTNPEHPWLNPDWYIQSVSGGLGPIGVIKGFKELSDMGFTVNKLPKIANIQAEGCAPMVHGWKQNKDTAVPINSPITHIETLATGDPGETYTKLRAAMKQASGGVMESVTDEEAFRAMHLMAKMEGISIEPAAAVAVAGLIKMVRAGQIHPDEIVVINCTGHTMPIEPIILGDGWSQDINAEDTLKQDKPEEGLLSALDQVSNGRYKKIALVEDHPDARRLIRRILQSQDDYAIFEADNGKDAVSMIFREKPDLIILDLMMPDLDGFGVLDRLKQDKDFADIPVIVVTAKDLTPSEKAKLKGRIKSLMQKGEFLSDELQDEIHALLG